MKVQCVRCGREQQKRTIKHLHSSDCMFTFFSTLPLVRTLPRGDEMWRAPLQSRETRVMTHHC